MTLNGPIVFIAFCCVSAFGQQTSKLTNSTTGSTKEYPLPVENVDLGGEGKHIVGVPNTNSMGYPVHGASDGTIFVEMFDQSKQSSLFVAADLYAISEDAKVTTIQRKSPDDMERVVFRDLYASDSLVASLLTARPRKKSPDEPTSRETDYFICLSKRDGTFEKLISLKDLKLEPLKIAVLESGRFFVAGIDNLNKTPVLAMLDSDGQYLRPVTLDNRPFDNSKSLQTIYPNLEPGAGAGEAAIGGSGFVPFGNRILFYVPGAKLPVYILGEGGEENSIQLHLPKEYLIETILPCSKHDTWVVRAQAVKEFAQMQSMGVISNPQQALFEVNPSNGRAIRRLDISGAFPGQVDSAANKKLICLREITVDLQKDPAVWVAVEQDR